MKPAWARRRLTHRTGEFVRQGQLRVAVQVYPGASGFHNCARRMSSVEVSGE